MRRLAPLLALIVSCSATPPAPVPLPQGRSSALVIVPRTSTVPLPATCPHLGTAIPPSLSSNDLVVDDTDNPDGRFALAKPEKPGDLCGTADENLARAEAAILADEGSTKLSSAPLPPARPWDHRARPAYLEDISRRFALEPAETALLERAGFVVPARLEFPTYAFAFHEIYQSELPVYVSVDAILHAVYEGNDSFVGQLELRRLAPLLDSTLETLSCALPTVAADYPDETAHDLDVYLSVARSLLADHLVPAALPGNDDDVSALVDKARAAAGMEEVELFGRSRRIDFTQLTPRGHYASIERLTPYFRAAMWLSRLEFNLVSRSCRSSAATPVADPAETPREALDAFALADLVARAGAADAVDTMDRAWAALGGRREDVPIAQLAALRARAAVGSLREPDAFERLKAAIGDGFQRRARLHYMPEGTTTLPAIATLLGPRVVADTLATAPLVEPKTAGRHVIGAAEMGYALGHDRARAHLAGEITRFPALAHTLDDARALAHVKPLGEDLYGAWFQAILGLAARPAGATPSFMKGEAFADLRLGSAIAAFGQIRHNSVLFAGQGYDQGGCEIPDGYVEPAPAVYDALIAYAERGAAVVAAVDPSDLARSKGYFTGLARVLRVLRAIGAGELKGRALSTEERRFLSMILEMRPGTSEGPPTFTGWYFDLFPKRDDALARADFIADYFTSGHEGTVSYVGATAPRLGVFVIDTGGAPRAAVGPVARAYEHHGPLAKRLDDEAASHLTNVAAPWAASYTVPAAPEPDLDASCPSPDDLARSPVTVTAKKPLGPVTIELLDHHRKPLQSLTRTVGAGVTSFQFKAAKPDHPVEVMHVKAGAFHGWAEVRWTGGSIVAGASRQ